MKLISSRKFAWAVTAVIMAAAVLFGSHRSLNALAAKVTGGFYDGVYDEKQDYTQPSIDSQLDKCIDASMGVLSVVNHYDSLKDVSQSLRDARQALIDADTIGEKFDANSALKAAYNGAVAALEDVSLSESDETALKSYRSTFDGAQGVIEKSLYNESVREFEDSIGSSFPAGFLSGLTGVDMPEYFN